VKKIIIISILLTQFLNAADNYYYKNGKVAILTPLNSTMRSLENIDYYQNERGVVFGVKNTLLLKLEDEQNLQNYLNEFDLTIKKSLGKNLYLLQTTDKALTVDIANRLSEKEDVAYAHPDFIKKRVRR